MPTHDLKIEAIPDSPGRHTVRGPYEPDYGRQHYGWVEKDGRSFRAFGSDRRTDGGKVDIGLRPTLKAAAAAVGEWAGRTLTAEALSNEFEGRTAGGWPIRFLRRAAGSVVAIVTEPNGGRTAMTWNEDGTCAFHDGAPEGSAEARRFSALRLVRKEPAPGNDADESVPAPRP